MKKRLSVLFLLLCMSVTLTGCMEYKVSDKIDKNGTCTETLDMYVNKQEYIDYVNKLAGTTGAGQTTPEQVDKLMTENGCKVQVIDGVEYYMSSKDSIHKVESLEKLYKSNQPYAIKGGYQFWETGFSMKLEAVTDDLKDSNVASAVDAKEKKTVEELFKKCFLIYSVEFDYDIVKTDKLAVIDSTNPKKASWKISFDKINKNMKIYADCNSGIKVSGVTQGSSYKKPVKLHFEGVTEATYKGKKISNNKKFSNHGQHTVVLKAADGEQRTVCFFIDKKAPIISKLKNGKTYKGARTCKITDKDSGIASVTINGKKVKIQSTGNYRISKKGTNRIVVKDNVGNVKKMKVKIK